MCISHHSLLEVQHNFNYSIAWAWSFLVRYYLNTTLSFALQPQTHLSISNFKLAKNGHSRRPNFVQNIDMIQLTPCRQEIVPDEEHIDVECVRFEKQPRSELSPAV